MPREIVVSDGANLLSLNTYRDESLSVSLVKKLTKINFFLGSNGVRDFENWKKKEKKKKEGKKKEKEEGKNRDTRRVREIGEEWNDSIRAWSSTIDNIAVTNTSSVKTGERTALWICKVR